MTKHALKDTMWTLDTDYMFLIRGAFILATRNTMTSMLEIDGVREVFESASIQLASCGPVVRAIFKMVVSEKTFMVPETRFVAN